MNRSFGYRLLEMIPATLSWSILILPVVLSFVVPLEVSIFIAAFVFLWFFRTVEYIWFLLLSYFRFRKYELFDFETALKNWEQGKNLTKEESLHRQILKKSNDFLLAKDIRHIVIIATCGEPFEVLDETIIALSESKYDMKKVLLCLATEERMGEESAEIAVRIQEKFKGQFGRFFHTVHPDGIFGEVRGKGGNITHAGREVTKILESEGAKLENYLVTTLDADNKVHQDYLSSLTLAYIRAGERQNKSYQPLPLFFNNIWEVPLLNRMIAISGGFWHMVESARPYRLHNFSSHAQPLKALKDMDFWAVDTIVEDGHQYWRSYFHFSGKYSVEPLFVPIYQDAVMNKNFQKTVFAQYKQIRRWAWGCSDIPFVLVQWWKNAKNIPVFETLIHFLRLMEGHIFWATGAIMITLATPVPGMLNQGYGDSIYSANISSILSFFFQISLSGIFVMMILSFITLPKPPKKMSYFKIMLQWIFIPVMTIGFGAIPALEAQTRLFFGKYLGFNVTEKIRE
ncbi:MAG: glycosyltransferase family 2 protein [Candidatus Peregrinibacteria bacterium]